MKKTKVCAIISNRAGELLLQRRDENPGLGKWVLFGGSVHDGEAEMEALRREIMEELGYGIKDMRFLMRCNDNGTHQVIFVVAEPVEATSLELHEGSAMGFFNAKEIESLDVGFNFKKILLDYLHKKTDWPREIIKIIKKYGCF